MKKRSETIKDAMIDMQLLLRGVWRFHSDEGQEFMGAVDDWLREHTQSFTLRLEPMIRARTVLSKRVLALENVVFDVSCTKRMHLCVWPDAAEHANEINNHSKRTVPGQNDVVEPIVLERRAFSGQAVCALLPRERPL